MINQILVDFAHWLYTTGGGSNLHESFYMYPWVETTHVLTVMVSLGMLIFIDLRMLGWTMTHIPASTIAARLNIPMIVGFVVMFITGLLLFYAIPIRNTQSIWFRIKMVLLLAAAINMILFHRAMVRSVSTWDRDPVPPKRIRMGAGISLALWAGVVTTGRLIAYDWYDCYREMPGFLNWAAGCMVDQPSTW